MVSPFFVCFLPFPQATGIATSHSLVPWEISLAYPCVSGPIKLSPFYTEPSQNTKVEVWFVKK